MQCYWTGKECNQLTFRWLQTWLILGDFRSRIEFRESEGLNEGGFSANSTCLKLKAQVKKDIRNRLDSKLKSRSEKTTKDYEA